MSIHIARPSDIHMPYPPDFSPPINGFAVCALCEKLDYAFQPIVNIHTGAVFGFEALLRGLERIDFPSVARLFDGADEAGSLLELESALRDKAIDSFAAITNIGANIGQARLLFNLDSRSLIKEPRRGQMTHDCLSRHGLPTPTICFELT